MLYYLYDSRLRVLQPLRTLVGGVKKTLTHPLNPLSFSPLVGHIQASCEVFEHLTQEFKQQEFAINHIVVDGQEIKISQEVVLQKPFCRLTHFKKSSPKKQPKILVVAPLSGHYATLVRDTVATLLKDHDVYVTDWINAREIPMEKGHFTLSDNIQYIMDFIRHFDGKVHLLAVCQPAVPVLAAVALLAQQNAKEQPLSMTLMGGPIDTRVNPSKVNTFAKKHSLDWFKKHMITKVPFYYEGKGRHVYPGFLQLSGFLSLNPERHLNAQTNFFDNLVKEDHASAEKHRLFYNEYLSVMDITAEFFLETIEKVFLNHDLPKGTLKWRGQTVDLSAIRQTALFTIEGESDDISPKGQTFAAQGLCSGLPATLKRHYLQKGVGHYGLFSGHRWRDNIMPEIRDFIKNIEKVT